MRDNDRGQDEKEMREKAERFRRSAEGGIVSEETYECQGCGGDVPAVEATWLPVGPKNDTSTAAPYCSRECFLSSVETRRALLAAAAERDRLAAECEALRGIIESGDAPICGWCGHVFEDHDSAREHAKRCGKNTVLVENATLRAALFRLVGTPTGECFGKHPASEAWATLDHGEHERLVGDLGDAIEDAQAALSGEGGGE